MAHHQPYPPFDVECIQDIFRLVRGRTVRDELPLFAKCVYTLVGAGLSITLGEPNDGPMLAGQPADALEGVSDDELQKCCQALEQAEGEVQTFGAGDAEAEKLDPATLALLIQLAIQVIQAIINRRKPKPA